MIYFLLIFFRVIPPQKSHVSNYLKPAGINRYEYLNNCQDNGNVGIDKKFEDYGSINKDAIIYCEKKNPFIVSNSVFSKINIYRKWGAEYNAYILWVYKTNAEIKNNNFSDCTVRPKVIYCQGDSYSLTLHNNKFNNCIHKNSGSRNEVIGSDFKKENNIQNNSVIFNDLDKSGRAFFIQCNRNTIFNGNYIKNANYNQESGGLLIKDTGSGNPLQFKHNIFVNCFGNQNDNGVALMIYDVRDDFVFENNTFQNNKNEYTITDKNVEYYKGYFMKFDCNKDYNPSSITFLNCKFSYLECDGQSGGGIGLLYRSDNNNLQFKLTFDGTTFEHLYFTHKTYGGGAICFASEVNENKRSLLTVLNCIFHNVTSKCGGGAIYYNAPQQELMIDNCTFTDTYTRNDGQFGGAIYVKLSEDPMPITITNCNFTNTYSSKGGAIYIERNENSNSPISISNCVFTRTKADADGHSIVIDKSASDQVTISNCCCYDCGTNQDSYAIVLDVSNLDFNTNKIIFSDTDQSCGCILLKKIGSHSFRGNVFQNAHIKDEKMWNSAGIHSEEKINTPSLVIEDNIFDHIPGVNQGRCIFADIQGTNTVTIRNNTIQNCPSGGILIKIIFNAQEKPLFTFDSCRFINNTIKENCYSSIGPTPHFWIQNPFEGNDMKELTLTFENCEFENNHAPDGGALFYGKNWYSSNIKLSLKNCKFDSNSASNGASAISVHTYQGIEIDNCNFTSHKSEGSSGTIVIETDFQCLDDSDGNNEWYPAPQTRNPIISITNCIIENSERTAGHEISTMNSPNAPLTVFNCKFTNCGTTGYLISTNAHNNLISNCTFGFTIETTSRGIYSTNEKIELLGNHFQNLKDTVIQLSCLQSETNQIKLIENKFVGLNNGYALYAENQLSTAPLIQRNEFEKADSNLPLFHLKLKESITSFTFDNNTFKNLNIDHDIGGFGLDLSNENEGITIELSFIDCVFIENSNKKKGGAIACDLNQNNGNILLKIQHCYFQKNNNEDKGASVYANVRNDVLISDSSFSENSGTEGGAIYIVPDINGNTQTSLISITNCHFDKNEGNKGSSIHISSGQTKTLKIESCDFNEDQGCVYIDDFPNTIDIKYNSFTNILDHSMLVIKSTTSTSTELTIERCVFDSYTGTINKCFEIVINRYQFEYNDNVIQNIVGNGCDSYLGLFDFKKHFTFELQNISFINNSCDCLYGGGTGLQLLGASQISFINCKFINNRAKQNTGTSRPTKSSDKPYYNGDGGGIQLGFSCEMNDFHLLLQECFFSNNKAHRHGGAIAIQTLRDVTISNCIFENNEANCNSENSELLYENHFDKKSEGRGGAIYINPVYSYDDDSLSCKSPSFFMSKVIIEECKFNKNNGYDGYAMYFEGDDPKANYLIQKNDFFDNYNEKNHDGDQNKIYGAVITTEILSLSREQIIKDNNFSYTILELTVPEVSYVDHYGKTATKPFSKSEEFTESNTFPTSIFTDSKTFSNSLLFTKSNKFSQSKAFTKSDTFSQSKEFSKSQTFTKSDTFSQSKEFSKSQTFTKSDTFTKSKEFSKSQTFSASNLFSKSSKFSPSSPFSNSGTFHPSNVFSPSNTLYVPTEEPLSSSVIKPEISELSSISSDNEISSSTNNDADVESSSNNDAVIESSSNNDAEVESSSTNNDAEKESSTNNDVVIDSSSTSSDAVIDSSSTSSDAVIDSSSTNNDAEVESSSTNNDAEVESSSTNNDAEKESSTNNDVVIDSSSTSSDAVIDSSSTSSDAVIDSSSTNNDAEVESSSTNNDAEVESSSTNNDAEKESSTNNDVVIDSSSTSSDAVIDSSSTNNDAEVESSSTNNDAEKESSTNNDAEVESSTNNDAEKESSTNNDVVIDSSSTSSDAVIESSTNSDAVIDSSSTSSDVVVESSANSDAENSGSSSTNKDSESSDSLPSNDELSDIIETTDADLPIKVPDCEVIENRLSHLVDKCNYSSEGGTNVLVKVVVTNFTDYHQPQNGGAINLNNCGFQSNNVYFINCTTRIGGGGAIYIKNTLHLEHNITLDGLHFIDCKASYGGAVYIYLGSKYNGVTCRYCSFISNKAFGERAKNGMYGGAAMFLTSNNIDVVNCTFHRNSGNGGLKIYNVYDDNDSHSASQLDEGNENKIAILNCDFESEPQSKDAVSYESGKERIQVDIVNCDFKGKESDVSHYINGVLTDKKQLRIKSCNFEYENMNIGKSSHNDKENHFIKRYYLKSSICLVLFVVALMIVILIKSNKYHFSKEDKNDALELYEEYNEDFPSSLI